jgi:hypothetical protein
MMRFIKAFIFGITGLSGIITLLSLLIPSNVRVSRTTVINFASKDQLLRQTADLMNWQHWHPMFKAGVAKINYSTVSAGKNAACDIIYNGKATHLVITNTDTASVEFSLQSPGENDVENTIAFIPMPSTNDTRVEWRANTKMHWYPWEKFYAIFMDKLTGPGYDAALNGLKEFMESKPTR